MLRHVDQDDGAVLSLLGEELADEIAILDHGAAGVGVAHHVCQALKNRRKKRSRNPLTPYTVEILATCYTSENTVNTVICIYIDTHL